MVWFLLLMMVTACHATVRVTRNLEGQSFIFPKSTATDNVELYPNPDDFDALTVCLRIKTDLCRDHALFSAAGNNQANLFLIFYDYDNKELEVKVRNREVEFKGLKYDLNKWHSICVTWDSITGFVQLWIDGHKTVKEFTREGRITNLNIFLGQDAAGGFEEEQSFVGEITDVHMWDSVIDACEIQNYIEYRNFCPGNALNWRELQYYITGSIVTGYNQICPQLPPQVVYPSITSSSGLDYYRNNYLSYGADISLYKADYGYYKNANSYYGPNFRYYGIHKNPLGQLKKFYGNDKAGSKSGYHRY